METDETKHNGKVVGAGRLPIPVIEERARQQDAPLWASVAKTADPRDGLVDITYAALKRAIDRVAWYLDEQLGKGSGETFAFMTAPYDIRYGVLAFATMKTGHVAFYPSPRNSPEAQMSLLQQTGCKRMFLAQHSTPMIDQLVEDCSLQSLQFPDNDVLLKDEAVPDYPFHGSADKNYHQPFVCLHTSGSTGIPKPIVIKQAWVTMHDVGFRELPKPGANSSIFTCEERSRLFSPFPGFHAAGLSFLTSLSVHAAATLVLPAPSIPITAETVDMFHVHANVNRSCLTASTLEDMYHNPRMLANLDRLDEISVGGAPVGRDVGNAISKRTRLVSNYSMTETGPLVISRADPEDWAYLQIPPGVGAEMRPCSDEVSELVFTRHPASEKLNAIWTTFPDLSEWSTKDLFRQHPNKPDYWCYQGRADDIITFSNGKKLNPRSFEQLVETHKDISGALVVGTGQFQSALLLELRQGVNPPEDAAGTAKMLDSVWPLIEQANDECVAHGRVDRDYVMFAAKSKPFLRASKGTIQRRLTVQSYEPEIETMYSKNKVNGVAVHTSSNRTPKDFEKIVKDFLQANLKTVPDPNIDLFSLGLDSRLVLNLVRVLNRYGATNVTLQTIYNNNTVAKLSSALDADQSKSSDQNRPKLSREQQMDALLERHCSQLVLNGRERSVAKGNCVLLTGSTGSLGSYILDSLTKSNSVERIICANRARKHDMAQEQAKNQRQKGLNTSLKKVEFIAIDISKPRLGLENSKYRDLLASVTNIIHNAWRVDFNLALDSFTSHIHGTQQLSNLCALSRHGASISFLSSVGTVLDMRKDGRHKVIAEKVFRDWSVSGKQGYGESKHVCELLVDEACKFSDVDGRILRLGQVAGPIRRDEGVWNEHEWFPSIIKSSKTLGVLPNLESVDSFDWIPVDVLGDTVTDLALSGNAAKSSDNTENGASVFNLVNPSPSQWSSLQPSLEKRLGVKTVELEAWIERLETEAETADEKRVEQLPALKLLPFYKELATAPRANVPLATDQAQAVSATLRELEPVQAAWLDRWMGQWNL